MLRKQPGMMTCGRLGFRFVHTGDFSIRSSRLGVALSRVAASGRLVPQCSASGQSESNAPVQRIAAEDNPFVKPLSNIFSVVPCRLCQGSGEMKCDVCDGQGSLARGGFHKRNPVTIARIVGSKWTAMESTFGWRHFHVHSKRRGPGKDWFLEMVSTCDETTRFWLNAKILKDRERWAAGWLQKEELLGMQGRGKQKPQSARRAKVVELSHVKCVLNLKMVYNHGRLTSLMCNRKPVRIFSFFAGKIALPRCLQMRAFQSIDPENALNLVYDRRI